MLYNCETPYPETVVTCEPFNRWKKSIHEFGGKSNNLEQNKRDFWDYLSSKKSWTVKTHTEQFKFAIKDHALLYKIADCVVYLQRRDKVAQMNKKKGLGLQKCEQDIYKNYRGRWSKNLEN